MISERTSSIAEGRSAIARDFCYPTAGYSSLAYLHELAVDEIKIDRSYVTRTTEDRSNGAIVRAAVELGHNLGLRVVAEGVENRQAWDLFALLGCDLAQGYHIAKSMSADEAEAWLSDPQVEISIIGGLASRGSQKDMSPPGSQVEVLVLDYVAT